MQRSILPSSTITRIGCGNSTSKTPAPSVRQTPTSPLRRGRAPAHIIHRESVGAHTRRPLRTVRDPLGPRGRRHGRGVPRQRYQARSRRGAEAAAGRRGERPRPPATLRARSTRRLRTESSRHCRHLRSRPGRITALHQHGAGRRQDAATDSGDRADAAAASFADCRPDRRRAREGPRSRDRSPGSQAGKPDGLARRVRQDSRLRPGEARRRSRVGRGPADQDQPGHPARHRDGDDRLHVPRAGERRRGRQPLRSVFVRSRALRDAHRTTRVHRPTAVETLSAIIREDPPSVAGLNPSVPAPVQWIVDRCLAKAPSDRYGATRDLARDLGCAPAIIFPN